MNLLRPEFSTAIAGPDVQLVGALAGPSCRSMLVRRLLLDPDDRLAALRAINSREDLIVLGDAEVLPWIDGLVYLRACRGESSVCIPSTAAISVPEDLFARALRAAHPEIQGSLVALPRSRRLIPLHGAQTITRAHLQGWRAPS